MKNLIFAALVVALYGYWLYTDFSQWPYAVIAFGVGILAYNIHCCLSRKVTT